MSLTPEVSVPVALATGVVVYSIFQNATPSIVDIRAAKPQDGLISDTERSASWLAAGVVAGVSLIAKDPTVFVVGGLTVVAMAWWTRHANEVNPASGKAASVSVLAPKVTQAQGYEPTPAYAVG